MAKAPCPCMYVHAHDVYVLVQVQAVQVQAVQVQAVQVPAGARARAGCAIVHGNNAMPAHPQTGLFCFVQAGAGRCGCGRRASGVGRRAARAAAPPGGGASGAEDRGRHRTGSPGLVWHVRPRTATRLRCRGGEGKGAPPSAAAGGVCSRHAKPGLAQQRAAWHGIMHLHLGWPGGRRVRGRTRRRKSCRLAAYRLAAYMCSCCSCWPAWVPRAGCRGGHGRCACARAVRGLCAGDGATAHCPPRLAAAATSVQKPVPCQCLCLCPSRTCCHACRC